MSDKPKRTKAELTNLILSGLRKHKECDHGFKVILKAMDWSTNLIARARKDPPDKGGWNLLHTWWQAGDVLNPPLHFRVSAAGASDPARFIYACEDGMLRAWTPTVPTGWSTRSEVVVDEAAEAAVFRGVALAGDRIYATDFHNGRVDVYDGGWRRVRRTGAFEDPAIPSWYAPFGVQAIAGSVFVTYVGRAPVNGNDAPTGGYVDEYDLAGRFVAHVARMGELNAPWGLAQAPPSFGRFGGDLLVGNFGDGRINAYRRTSRGWAFDGVLRDARSKPIVVNGLWGIGFGNGGAAGPRDTLFFASGPHEWRGATELGVHGLLGSISAR